MARVQNAKFANTRLETAWGVVEFDKDGMSQELTESDARNLEILGFTRVERDELKKVFREAPDPLEK